MIKSIQIIAGLSNGGAESVLYRLCTSDNPQNHHVVSMMGLGKYGPLLVAAGVRVTCLNLPAGRVTLPGLWRLYHLLRKEKPTVVQTWMYHADLIGGVIARLAGIKNICWNIRHSELELGKSKRSTIWVAKSCAFLSKWVPRKIVCCAEKAKQVHIDYGYDASKMVVIGNGYNLEQFKPDSTAHQCVRAKLGLSDDTFLLGMVGRFNVQKNHKGLLNSLSLLKAKGVAFKCALVGTDLNQGNQQLTGWITELGLGNEMLLMDQRTDIPDLMNAFDIHVFSSSFGEGFPNVLAEAMACGTPCLTTDVGDAVQIVGETGWIVPVNDNEAFADALCVAIDEMVLDKSKWLVRCHSARERVVRFFSLDSMKQAYLKVWAKK
ncbi:glycosyltransferase family 4 protein [Marinospirillum sp.]|uniref:glycosyltransferase family 4 protein n=1 Tax=Marinospirillum sp. TaxID=2183934 RepID=UPI00384BA9AF